MGSECHRQIFGIPNTKLLPKTRSNWWWWWSSHRTYYCGMATGWKEYLFFSSIFDGVVAISPRHCGNGMSILREVYYNHLTILYWQLFVAAENNRTWSKNKRTFQENRCSLGQYEGLSLAPRFFRYSSGISVVWTFSWFGCPSSDSDTWCDASSKVLVDAISTLSHSPPPNNP